MFDPAPILSGDRRLLARLLTQIENTTPLADEALAALYPHTGRAHLIGVTGAPGTGKSSLVNELTKAYRRAGRTVAIIAVDPTSPFTGGALLGDRIRMRDLAGDAGVFIRSMASRGALGGLARATADIAKALDAAGFDKVIVETVGAGQSEVDIARMAHTTIVVEAPGLGDDVQGIKAGILEIADVLVVNKADQPGVEAALRALRVSLELASPPTARAWRDLPSQLHHHLAQARPLPQAEAHWTPPLLQTVAVEGQGVPAVLEAVEQHRAYLHESGALRQRERERLAYELEARVRDALFASWLVRVGHRQLDHILDKLQKRELDPHTAARQLIG
jgi:LAO/AO transport system kinase